MVAETSEASKAKVLLVKTTRAPARVAKSADSENNTCTSTCRIAIAKRASDVMTQTRLRQTNWNGG